jgi:hypothetical protein
VRLGQGSLRGSADGLKLRGGLREGVRRKCSIVRCTGRNPWRVARAERHSALRLIPFHFTEKNLRGPWVGKAEEGRWVARELFSPSYVRPPS